MIDNLLLGFSIAASFENLVYLTASVFLGTLIGILPGLGPAAAIAIFLPLTFNLGPVTGIIILAGLYYGSQYGGSTTSILLNTPGESSSVMTCIDGNKMAKDGRAGAALFAAAFSSFIAGIIMVCVIAVVSPALSGIAFKFGPAEYTLLMLFGFMSVTLLTGDNLLKGLSIALLGTLFGIIGTDINSGIERFTFDSIDLINGIPFVAVAVGIFAVTEIIKNITEEDQVTQYTENINLFPSKEDIKRVIPAALRGTAVGGFLGLLPGGGITVSSYAAYALDKKISKNRKEFGNGAIEGVAAPEAANNASAQSGFIPLISLGLPENAVMSLMLGALIIHGIVPGPMVIQNHPDLFWGLLVSMILGNFILLILNFPFVKIWIYFLKIPYYILYPIILTACCLGVYSISNNVNDILLIALFGAIGYVFLILDLSPVTFILGFVLGDMFEDNFRRSLAISDGDFSIFYKSDIAITLLVLIALLISTSIFNVNKQDK